MLASALPADATVASPTKPASDRCTPQPQLCCDAQKIDRPLILLRRRAPLQQERDGREHLGSHLVEGLRKAVKIAVLGQRCLVEIESAINLQLQRLHAARRV